MRALTFVYAFLFRLDRVNSDKLIGNAVRDFVMDRLTFVSLVSRMLDIQVAAADYKYRTRYSILTKYSTDSF